MGKTVINIVIILGLVVVAFAAFFLYNQRGGFGLDLNQNERVTEVAQQEIQVFIEYRKTLDQIEIDDSVLEDIRFTALRDFSDEVEELPVGRTNPFTEPTEDDYIIQTDPQLEPVIGEFE
jgi:hypothetical protein